MKDMIAYCGLDCEKCDAYRATINDDQALRERTAKLWSELNNAAILPDHINCQGCRVNGVKTVYCESLCAIRQCAMKKAVTTCGDCPDFEECQTVGGIIKNNPTARKNLKMTFAEKLKSMRKQSGMSQEKLAEKIGVSRQAITKWENNTGIPDIENMFAISSLFNVSVDELLSNEKIEKKQTDYLYESVTEYDIDNIKRYDMNLGGANTLVLSGYEGEKIRVRLASNTLATLQSDFKVKIDDCKNHIDVDISRKNGMTEANAKEQVMIFVQLPSQYIDRIEASINAGKVEVKNLNCENLELETKTHNVIIDRFVGTLEIDCNLDMNIVCNTLSGSVEVNQISATSRISVPENAEFTAVKKGIGTSILYEKNGKRAENFSTADSENVIELNGMKSELVICRNELN